MTMRSGSRGRHDTIEGKSEMDLPSMYVTGTARPGQRGGDEPLRPGASRLDLDVLVRLRDQAADHSDEPVRAVPAGAL
jgi:hypothetical protein